MREKRRVGGESTCRFNVGSVVLPGNATREGCSVINNRNMTSGRMIGGTRLFVDKPGHCSAPPSRPLSWRQGRSQLVTLRGAK